MKSDEAFSASPVIRLVENREVIERKLREYESRFNGFGAPETQWDTIYKIAVARRLVETGEVNTHDLSRELWDRYGFLDDRLFNRACGVMADYITTGGKNLYGGTGLDGNKGEKRMEHDENNGGDGRVM